MSARLGLFVSLLFLAPGAVVGCGEAFSTGSGGAGASGTSTASSGTTSSATGTGGDTSVAATSGPGTSSTGPGGGEGGMAPCGGALDQDDDGDGVNEGQGDCDDCHADIGPGSMELPGNEVDEDCDSSLEVALLPCDTGLSLASQDPMDAAKAIGLCKPATEGWGLVSAEWLLPDGNPWDEVGSALYAAYHLGHGIVPDFGPMMHVQEGKNLLALSTGTARRPLDAGYIAPTGAGKGYSTGTPPGYPKGWPSCPGIIGGTANVSPSRGTGDPGSSR
jgi:hypothetical protein